MRREGLSRFYDRLTPEERFKLFIEARARDDEDECRRLEESCSKRIYEMNEATYRDRVKASEDITLMVCLDLAPPLMKLKMLSAFSGVLTSLHHTSLEEVYRAFLRGKAKGARSALKSLAREGYLPEPDEDEPGTQKALDEITSRVEGEWSNFTDTVERLRQDAHKEVIIIWQAFSRFSWGNLEMGPEKLVKAWFEPVLLEIEEHISDAPPYDEKDAKKREEYERILRRLWSTLVT